MDFNLFTKKQKAQAEESFRLLIAFVITVAILSIILVMVRNINNKAIIISQQKLEEGIISASKAPGISTQSKYIIEDLKLKGTISKEWISGITGIEKGCIGIDNGPGIEPIAESNELIYEITERNLDMDVTIYCNISNSDEPSSIYNLLEKNTEDCEKFIVLFLNKNAPDEIYKEGN
ncbi:MAG: hypothetical protein PHR26_02225 [Candidatus ainarchaeum sp.]|nr:hypothetical protein [Candidatus ainarchaeum sp.]MDD3976205.1 hypothetical protein [Candidatus ainarchaeum sp.]